MRYDKLMALITSSESSDWVCNEPRRTYVFREDLDIRIEQCDPQAGEPFEDVLEEWAANFPDPKAHKVHFDIFYHSTCVKRFTLVSVDGGRALLPFPISASDRRVPRSRYLLARTVDEQGSLDEYMKRSGMTVIDSDRSLIDTVRVR